MKVSLNIHNVVVESENVLEAAALLAVTEKYTKKTTTPKVKKTKIKRVHTKRCDFCGKGFRGQRGLSVHKSTIHGVLSQSPAAVYMRNQKEQRKKTGSFAETEEVVDF